MAGQSSLREDLNVLRRRESERRNQETQQYRDVYQETTPLFGEPYKTNKGDELSSLIQKMLGNYEEGHSCAYDGVLKDCAYAPMPTATTSSSCSSLSASYGRSGLPTHRDKLHPPFQKPPSYDSPHTAPGGHASSEAHQPDFTLELGKDAPADTSLGTGDTWPDGRDFTAVLPDLTPPADPLSPLHSSESSDSEHEGENDGGRAVLSPARPDQTHHPRGQKETSLPAGDALPPASQTYPLPLSSKPNLTNSKKPMALVRPMDGSEQVASESPDLKASPGDFHRASYEGLPELKAPSKQGLPALKMPAHTVEVRSSELHCVEDILREMTHSCPPLLTAIHTPSSGELSKFSFPSKETHVQSGYQQPQKHLVSSPRATASPCGAESGVCEDSGAAVLAPSSGGGESGSSSDSESSSGSDTESSDNSESGIENTHSPNNTPPVKAEGPKDISWQLISWIKENQQNLNPQNHDDEPAGRNPKTAANSKPQPRTHPAEDPKARSKRHYNSHTAPVQQPEFCHVTTEPAASSQTADHKPAVSRGDTEAGPRKTVGTKRPGRGRKAPPLPEDSQASLQVETVEVTPRDQDSTFTDRPKVKTKAAHVKSGGKSHVRKQAKRAPSDRKEATDTPLKATVTVEERKEAEPATSPSPASLPAKSRGGTGGVRTEAPAPVKGCKKRRTHSPTRERKRDGASRPAETLRPLLVKIELCQLTRVPQLPKTAKPNKVAPPLDTVPQKPGQKEPGTASKVGQKRPAEKIQPSVPRKKAKLVKEITPVPSSSQHRPSKTPALKTPTQEKEKRSRTSKKTRAPLPHSPSQDQAKTAAQKRPPQEDEESGHAGSKQRRKNSSKQVEHSKSHKKAPKSDVSAPEPATSCVAKVTHRPLLQFDDKQYSVDYHMKEAKKLKHKADATLGKMGKAFNYLDAAMSFVESGIAMETDPQTPKSAYTMFSETVDLIRFILRLKNYLEPSAPSSERDFLVLCMRCQAVLQMAMFRCKRDSALKYLRTLSDHFKNSKTVHAPSPCVSKSTGTPSPMSPTPSPTSSASSGPTSIPGGGGTVAIPQVVQQMACSYVNVTALFLSALDTWEQADELARKGSGLLNELDRAQGQLSLMSSMVALVRYTRQGLHWLQLDTTV